MTYCEITLVNDQQGAFIGGSTVGFLDTLVGPRRAHVYICATSTDYHLARAAERLEVPAEALMAFRDNSAHGERRALAM